MSFVHDDARENAEIDERIRQLDAGRDALIRLRAERVERVGRLASGTAGVTADRPARPPGPMSTREKLAIFRSLFRGREDVYPSLWENGGRKGYSPACAHEFVRVDDL